MSLVRRIMLRVWPLSALTHAYYRARFTPAMWTKVLNGAGRAALRARPVMLDAAQQHAVDEIRARGITVSRIESLAADPAILPRLQQAARTMFAEPAIAAQIRDRKSQVGGKDYVVRAFGDTPQLDLRNDLVQFALNERILAIAAAYLGMSPRLKYVDLWYNLPVDPASREVSSQRWHRDYDDYRIVKLFLYLEDVDAGTGPFSYMPETHAGARYGHLYPSKPPSGSYPPDGAIERQFGEAAALVCTGSAGTVIVADTAGFHRGGRALARPRTLFTATYASDASVEVDRFQRPLSIDPSALGHLARFALRMESRR